MSFLKKLLDKSSELQVTDVAQRVCPNCWGDQEYEDVIREKYKDPQIDVNNHKTNYAFVQNFIVTHLNGIKLKSTTTGAQCPRCRTIY